MKGRKAKYPVRELKIGKKIELDKVNKYCMHQYAYAYNKRLAPKQFVAFWKDEKAYIKRIK